MIRTMLTIALLTLAVSTASAEAFKSGKECVVGARVADSQNKTGTIVSTDGTMCHVKRDDGSSNSYAYIFWMLHPEGGSAETNDKLVPGKYACYSGREYTFMDINITGAATYSTKGGNGRFHVQPDRRIVFENGPLAKNCAKLVAGPNIDINADCSTFYATTCSYQKN
jgi:hypothetical protein